MKDAMVYSTLCITVDMWGDKIRHLNYVGAVAHYLKCNENKKHTLCTKALALKVMDSEEEKSAENVHQMILSILIEYDLYVDIDKIVFLSDRGPDIKAALQGYTRHFCLSHLINNTVQHASEPAIDSVLKDVSQIVKYMKVTGRNNKLQTLLVSYVSTRWNTRYDMFDSFIKAYDDVGPLIKQAKTKSIYDSLDMSELEAITKYLYVYKALTLEIEGDKEVNFVKILATIEMLKNTNKVAKSDHPTVKKMKSAANVYINSNVIHALPENYESWALYNPAWKKMDRFITINANDVIKKTTESISNIRISNGVDTTTYDETSGETSDVEVQSNSIFDSLRDSSANTNRSIVTNDATAEVTRYLEFPVPENTKIHLLDWWDLNATLFPRLYKKFLELAPIMCCTTSVERLFSHGGNCLTVKRNRLDPEILEQLVILSKNKDF